MVRFAALLPEPAQHHWLHAGQTEVTPGRIPRGDDDVRPSQWERCVQLLNAPDADAILAVLRRYVAIAIPDPARYEATFWTCTAFPSASLAGDRDYVRVNINWQEVCGAFMTRGAMHYTVYAARSPLVERFGPTLEDMAHTFAGVEATETTLVVGGADQFHLHSLDARALLAAMDDEDVQYAMRVFSLRLLNRGVCPWARHHNWFLADKLFAT